MEGYVTGGDPQALFEGAALDSRRIRGGELFFALSGEQTDGHLYVGSALESGAAGAVVDRPIGLEGSDGESGGCLVLVDDTYEALHELTRHVRSSFPDHLVAVTGSAGKTTTKELLAAMLATSFRTAASPGNLNNLYGFPLALLNLADDTEWMVAEMGMSETGELGKVSRLGRPDVVLLLNVLPVHLGSFGSLRAVGEAKAEIVEGLQDGGLIVLNAGDEELLRIGELCEQRRPDAKIQWFGLEANQRSRVQVLELEMAPEGRPGSRFDLSVEGQRAPVDLHLPGAHNVENCLAAATVALALGCDLQEIAHAASRVLPAPMRGSIFDLETGARVWDDSYNSNPDALERTLVAASQIDCHRRWAILGEMLELGPAASSYHQQSGRQAARLGFSPVVGVGELARDLVAGAEEGGAEVLWLPDAARAAEFAAGELAEGDLLLVKGSRGVGLEEVVRTLREGS